MTLFCIYIRLQGSFANRNWPMSLLCISRGTNIKRRRRLLYIETRYIYIYLNRINPPH